MAAVRPRNRLPKVRHVRRCAQYSLLGGHSIPHDCLAMSSIAERPAVHVITAVHIIAPLHAPCSAPRSVPCVSLCLLKKSSATDTLGTNRMDRRPAFTPCLSRSLSPTRGTRTDSLTRTRTRTRTISGILPSSWRMSGRQSEGSVDARFRGRARLCLVVML